jgi:hypothetical protein
LSRETSASVFMRACFHTRMNKGRWSAA